MYSEEETELRDLIMQNLENCGFLNKVKAELRAGVFLALEEDGNLKTKIPLFNQKFDGFINTVEGKLMIALIREFLEFYSLNFTLSVFDPEVASSTAFSSRPELCDQLNMKASEIDCPVIVSLLKDVIKIQNQNSSNKSSNEFSLLNNPIKSPSTEKIAEKITLENLLKDENVVQNEKSFIHTDLENDTSPTNKNPNGDSKDTFNISDSISVEDIENNKVADESLTNKDSEVENDNKNNIFKEPDNLLSPDHDPFFDEPLPSEKTSFFTFSESLKEKSESKLMGNNQRDLDDSKKSSLSSLRDLPSLTANHEWTFSRDTKNTLPSLDSLKSVSSSETSNEEIINLDSKESFEKKDSDIAESNEESSEKQNSEESIEEDIEEEFSGLDDLLNSNSLSLADDVTTDQTVSQISVVEGVDHVEPCK